MTALNLPKIRDCMVNAVREGGRLILLAQPSQSVHKEKKNNIVTETDQAVESLVFSLLEKEYPQFDLVGEESYVPGSSITDEPTFVLDPIDGTSNFVHGFPAVCVSLALVVGKKPTIGVVYNPFLDELYTGVAGQGSFTSRGAQLPRRLPLNESPLLGLKFACVGIEWGSDREGVNFDLNLKVFTTLARTVATGGRFVNSLRCTGSAAITICRVAAGQQDMFWECGCWVWDVAAAWCILHEAGGRIVDGHPGNWDPVIENRRYLAVRPATTGQEEIINEFWEVIGQDRSTYGPP
ncbi:hypothetical protein LTR27_006312 [Elasticomyces elasticus]|nr:hypothetical protein LTR27_006312 [Elasticomyces elasticus]